MISSISLSESVPVELTVIDCSLPVDRSRADPLTQRALEIQLALHRALGNFCDLRLDVGVIGQLVDAFLPDHGRIHVRDEDLRHANLVMRDQRIAGAEMVDQDATQGVGIVRRQLQLQDVAAEIEHLRLGEFHPRRGQRLGRRIEACFQSGRVCYQPGDEHG